jgi:NDP-mannose synthase
LDSSEHGDRPLRKAVILAGGLGTRLQPLTRIVPKPLLPIGESTVLEIQIAMLKRYGFEDVYIATNYMSDYLERVIGRGERYGIRVSVSREHKRLGTCGPVLLLRDELTEPFLMMNGDILTDMNFDAFSSFASRVGAELVVATTEVNIPFRFGEVHSSGDYLVGVEEKPSYKHEILAGIYVLSPSVFPAIPEDTYFGIDDLIRLMLSRRMPIGKYLMTEYWVDIGQLSDYEIAKETYATRAQAGRAE